MQQKTKQMKLEFDQNLKKMLQIYLDPNLPSLNEKNNFFTDTLRLIEREAPELVEPLKISFLKRAKQINDTKMINYLSPLVQKHQSKKSSPQIQTIPSRIPSQVKSKLKGDGKNIITIPTPHPLLYLTNGSPDKTPKIEPEQEFTFTSKIFHKSGTPKKPTTIEKVTVFPVKYADTNQGKGAININKNWNLSHY